MILFYINMIYAQTFSFNNSSHYLLYCEQFAIVGCVISGGNSSPFWAIQALKDSRVRERCLNWSKKLCTRSTRQAIGDQRNQETLLAMKGGISYSLKPSDLKPRFIPIPVLYAKSSKAPSKEPWVPGGVVSLGICRHSTLSINNTVENWQ